MAQVPCGSARLVLARALLVTCEDNHNCKKGVTGLSPRRHWLRQPSTFLALAAVFLGLFYVVARLGGAGADDRVTDRAGVTGYMPPQQFAGLPRSKLLSGEEARRQVSSMHGKAFAVRDAFVAEYADGRERVALWVMIAPDQVAAQTLVAKMTDRIGAANSVFSPPRPTQVAGVATYQSNGMGLSNYYYALGNRVYWLGLSSPREQELIANAVAGGL